jgi:Alpha-glutamyl/putrescinyl thymine pyrophosphorylase clade 3
VPTFCRHGRLEATCPICSRKAREGQAAAPRRATPRPARSSSGRSPSARAGGDLRVRRMARAADDGYEHDLLPGLRSSVDAGRLADEIAFSAGRLDELATDPPGLYAEVTGAADVEEATWLAFLITYLSPLEGDDPWASIEVARTSWASGELPMLEDVALGPRAAHDPARGASTLLAYRAWAERAGSQAQAFTGDPAWPDQRRFDRAFERLSLPGFGRPARYELLVSLGRLGVVALQPASLRFTDDATTLAAKRVFGIGDTMNLQRRASDLASTLGVPMEALDLALLNWSRPPGERITAGAQDVAFEDRAAALRRQLRAEPAEEE